MAVDTPKATLPHSVCYSWSSPEAGPRTPDGDRLGRERNWNQLGGQGGGEGGGAGSPSPPGRSQQVSVWCGRGAGRTGAPPPRSQARLCLCTCPPASLDVCFPLLRFLKCPCPASVPCCHLPGSPKRHTWLSPYSDREYTQYPMGHSFTHHGPQAGPFLTSPSHPGHISRSAPLLSAQAGPHLAGLPPHSSVKPLLSSQILPRHPHSQRRPPVTPAIMAVAPLSKHPCIFWKMFLSTLILSTLGSSSLFLAAFPRRLTQCRTGGICAKEKHPLHDLRN